MSETDQVRSDRETEFFAAIGRAVVIWSETEQAVFRVFCDITKGDTVQSAVIFGRAGTVAPRIELVRNVLAVSAAASTREGEELDGALLAIKQLADARNAIVHQPANWMGGKVNLAVKGDATSGRIVVASQDPGNLHIITGWVDRLRGKGKADARMDTAAIKSHHDQVAEAQDRLLRARQGILPRL